MEEPWKSWAADLERTFVSLVSVCHLFYSREAEPSFHTLRGLVERLTQQPFDNTTLKTLCEVHDKGVIVDILQISSSIQSFAIDILA